MPQRMNAFLLRGGLDLVTPAVAMPAGHCIGSSNYEPAEAGYARVGGWERHDGRPEPHKAQYWYLPFRNGDDAPAEGDVIEGGTSGATGTVLAAAEVTSGDFGDGDAAGYFILTDVVGTFTALEDLEVSSVKVAEATGGADLFGALTEADDILFRAAAAELRRDDIAAVPGSGPVRGVWVYGGVAYAFRDNAGATEGRLYKATGSGWTQVTPNPIVLFTAGSVRFTVGQTLTQGGVTGTIRAEVTTGGDYAGGTATGYLVLSGIAGGNYAAGAATDGAGGSATLSGAQSTPAIAPGGRFDCTNHNFTGAAGAECMYFANGTGRAFQWDGTTLAVIRVLSDALDKPTHVARFQNHLFLGFAAGSVLHSGIGAPLDFRTTVGAGEIAIGTPVTGLGEAAATALLIAGKDRMAYLTGTSSVDFVLQELSDGSGAAAWTVQMIGSPVYLDDLGLRDLRSTEAFGGFNVGTITNLVEPIFAQKRASGVTAQASVRVRQKDMYRLFWSDGTGLAVWFGGKRPEAMPFDYGVTAMCAASGRASDGSEMVLIGDDEGMVYRTDVGTSADGGEIEAWLRLAYNNVGAAYVRKRFHKATIELSATSSVALTIAAQYEYGDDDPVESSEQPAEVGAAGGVWDQSHWDTFYWSAREKGTANVYLDGVGHSCALVMHSSSSSEEPHTLTSVVMNWTPRGIVR